jgi:hypothetical protein
MSEPIETDTFAFVLTEAEAAAELARLREEAEPWRVLRRRLDGETDGD